MSFAMPILILLYFMVNGHNYDIRFSTLEIYGNAYQRPLEKMLRYIPEYKLALSQGKGGEADTLKGEIDKAFDELREVDSRLGEDLQFTEQGLSERGRDHLRIAKVVAKWDELKSQTSSSVDTVRKNADALTVIIREMITHAGDTSNLILDPDLDSYYMMDVTLLALPQTQDRLAVIMAYGADALVDGQLSPQEKLQLYVYATMLEEADYNRVLASIQTSLNEDKNFYGISPSLNPSISPVLKEYIETNQAFVNTLRDLAQSETPGIDVATFVGLCREARDMSFRLWVVGVEELDKLLKVRIDDYNSKRLWGLVMTGVAMIVAILLVVLIGHSITRPLGLAVPFAEQIAQGDFTGRLTIDQKDEVGTLTDALNNMCSNLGSMIHELRTGVGVLSSSSAELSAISRQMSENSGGTASRAGSFSFEMNRMSVDMVSVASAMKRASTNVSNAAGAMEVMSSTFVAVVDSTEQARVISNNAMTKATGVSERVNELGSAVDDIDKVTETITDISDQTNLLALNATIEAARAGESGKGFAVVANEIKELARQTVIATKDIKEKIISIQNSTAATIGDIEDISLVVQEVNKRVSGIAVGIAEQSTTTKDVAENICQATLGINEVNDTVAQSSQTASLIAEQSGEVVLASHDISSSSGQVLASAENLAHLAEQINTLTRRFKVNAVKP